MFTMTIIDNIREMFFVEGKSIADIIRETGYNRRTIKKYIEKDDWNEPLEKQQQRSKLEPFHKIINEWLENDKYQKKKQRHTARRIFHRLKEDQTLSFNCSYKTVANYVCKKRKELYEEDPGFLPLEHIPGEAQVDFGEADFIENGYRYTGKYLVLSFPYSNAGYYQLFFGETYECLAEGMKAIFTKLGGVPTRIWFDNASSMVISVEAEGKRKLTDNFLKFKAHYGFEAVYCNVAAGHEKGNVENKVGFLRRNFLVPIPEFKDIKDYNQSVFKICDNDLDRVHYKKKVNICDLFVEDKQALLALPFTALDIVNITTAKVNKYGKIVLNKGIHTYSTAPRLAGSSVTACMRAFDITILDSDFKEVVTHKRLYGLENKESMDWIPYLEQLSKKPTAIKYSGIYKIFPENIKEFLEGLEKREKGDLISALSQITKESSLEIGLDILDEAIKINISDKDSVISLYKSKNYDFEELTFIDYSTSQYKLKPISTNKEQYDQLLVGAN